jgi:hypothetical protein
LVWLVYTGTSKIPDLVARLRIRHDTLMRSVNRLVDDGLVETSTYREGLFGEYLNLHLTPEGYNIATRMAKQKTPAEPPQTKAAEPVTTPPAHVQHGTSGVQQQVTVRSGWEVCGYACILLIIVFVVLLAVARNWVCQTIPFIPC